MNTNVPKKTSPITFKVTVSPSDDNCQFQKLNQFHVVTSYRGLEKTFIANSKEEALRSAMDELRKYEVTERDLTSEEYVTIEDGLYRDQ